MRHAFVGPLRLFPCRVEPNLALERSCPRHGPRQGLDHGVALQVEGHAGDQARVIALDHGDARIAAQAAQAVTGEGTAGGVALVAAGVVVALVARLAGEAFAGQ